MRKSTAIFAASIALIIIVSVLSRRQFGVSSTPEIRKSIVGTWANEAGGSLALSADGSFSSSWVRGDSTRAFGGMWLIADGDLVLIATQRDNIPFVDTNRFKIIRADDHDLVYASDRQTNTLTR